MTHFNYLADQMGAGADDYDYTPELWDYDADPPDDDEQMRANRARLLTSPFGLDADEVGRGGALPPGYVWADDGKTVTGRLP